jgi:Holliday junction resolvasome RuvABC endonuclease subunit
MIILSLDPGKINFGFAVIQYDTSTELLLAGRFGSSIEDLTTNVECQVSSLARRIEDKIERFKPDKITCERYMTRLRADLNNEVVNIAIGVVLAIGRAHKIPVELVGAGTWKNYMQRTYGNNDMCDIFAHAYSDHASDAVGIAM